MSKGKILVVDDDRLVLATLSYGLTQAGFEVIDADNGDDAILLAREHRPELALLDIRMEGLTGFDVAAFHPLGYVVVVMLGAGVAERTGLFSAAMRAGVRNAPKFLLTPVIAFVEQLADATHRIDQLQSPGTQLYLASIAD